MAYDFNSLKKQIKDAEEFLRKELSVVRTGAASLSALDSVLVEAYGSRLPLNQTASVALEDPKTVRITPWDTSLLKPIERGVLVADLGVSVVADEKGVRVCFPDLTGERRAEMVKKIGSKLEEARIKLRLAREGVWDDIQKKEKDGIMGEDEKFRNKEEMEKLMQEANKSLEALASKKEKEISS